MPVWLKRVLGGEREVFNGRETLLGEPFEATDEEAEGLVEPPANATKKEREEFRPDPRFAKVVRAVARREAAKAKKAAQHPAAPVATGPGGIPADEVVELPPDPAPHPGEDDQPERDS